MERTTPKVDTKNMTVRITSALVFGVFFFSLLWFGDRPWAPWTYLAVMALAILGGVREMTLTYANVGNRNATGLVLTETVPSNTTFTAASSTLRVPSTLEAKISLGSRAHKR